MDNFSLTTFTTGLEETKPGLWRSRNFQNVDYPVAGNDACFALEESSFWFHQRNKIIKWAVQRFAPEFPFFDIGGGNGFVSKALNRSNQPVILVEPGEGAMNALKRNLPCVIQAAFSNKDFRNQSLPSVGLFDVIEHIEKDKEFLEKIHLALKPNGLVFATVPAYQFLWSAEDIEAFHHRRYTRKSIKSLFVDAGFEIEFSTYFFLYLIAPVLIFRTLPWRFSNEKGRRKVDASSSDHKAGFGFFRKMIDLWFGIELNIIEYTGGLPVGASILVVARKIE